MSDERPADLCCRSGPSRNTVCSTDLAEVQALLLILVVHFRIQRLSALREAVWSYAQLEAAACIA